LPKVGLFACFSGGSNTGSLTGMAALEVVRRLGSDAVGVCSLPAILSDVPRQSALVRRIGKFIVVDGCPLNCARKIVEAAGFTPDRIINLVEDCGLKKGPPLEYSDEDLQLAVRAISEAVRAED